MPATRAARMKSRVQSDSAAPRVSRAKTGTLKMPMAMIAFSAEGPKTAVIMMAMSSAGKAKTRSLPRMITSSSSEPRRAAAASPSGTPSPMPIPTATSATAIETRAPTMIIEKTSRPKWSVPSQCAAEGGCSRAGDVERRRRRRASRRTTRAPASDEDAGERPRRSSSARISARRSRGSTTA